MTTVIRFPELHRLPAPVIQAEILRGSLTRCGPGVRGIGWPDTPELRASLLKEFQLPGSAFVLLTAAWVWGHTWHEEQKVQLSWLNKKRLHRTVLNTVQVKQFNLPANECLHLADILVTSPERTIQDLLFSNEQMFANGASAAAKMLLSKQDDLSFFEEKYKRIRRPYSARALERFRSLVYSDSSQTP